MPTQDIKAQTMTVAAMVALYHDDNTPRAEGYRVVRLDHLSDQPPRLGLTVWRPDVRLHAPTEILDVTILGDDYDFMAVREVSRDDARAPKLVTAHNINPFFREFAVKYGLKEVEVREVLGSDDMIFVQFSTVPLAVLDQVPTEADPVRVAE